MSGSPDVLVIGGGLVGLSVARELAGIGAAVEVLEARRTGGGASSAGAGLLAPISDWDSTREFIAICKQARDGWKTWLEGVIAESGFEVEYDASGALLVGLDSNDDAGLDDEARIARAAGEAWTELPLAAARALVPELAPGAVRVAHLPGEHRVDNVAASAALAGACIARGVRIRERFRVDRVQVEEGSVVLEGADDGASARLRAALIVVAAGAWSGAIPGLPELPVWPVRGQMLRLGSAAWQWRGSLRLRHNYVVRRGADGLLVGATVEEAGFAEHPTAAGISGLLDFARTLFPRLAAAPVESIWAGLRPGSPDGRPILGAVGEGPVVAACGHYRNGILLAPWTGRVIADFIVRGKPIESAELFSPARPPGRVVESVRSSR